MPSDGPTPGAGRPLPLPAWARAGANRRWLAAISTSRWLLPVGIAVAAHALWLSGSSLTAKPRPPAPRLPVTDNTPELLRFSSGARQPVALAASLSTIDLPFGNSLPLPPPPPLETGQTTPRRSAAPAAPAPRNAAGSAGRSGLAWGVPPTASAGLPASAASALELVAQLHSKAGAAAAKSAASNSAASSSAASTAAGPDAAASATAAERPAKAEGHKAAGAALARRHLRLDASADRPYRLLWDTGAPASNRPDSLSELPESVELRRLPLAAAQAMGLSQPHGVSVQSSSGLLLLWVQGDQLWLIRQPAGTTRTAA